MFVLSKLSLRARLTLWSAAALLLIMGVLAFCGIAVVRTDMQAAAIKLQADLIDSVARDIDDKLSERREALVAAASVLGEADIQRPELATARLSAQPIYRGLFDVMMVADRAGHLTAAWPKALPSKPVSVADRPYFQQAMATQAPVIADPVAKKTDGRPTVFFATPIRGKDGQVVGALIASLELDRPNFLGRLSTQRIGKSGYFYMITNAARPTVVMHPDPTRLLQPVSQPFTGPVQRALNGAEDTVEDVNSAGLAALYSHRQLRSVKWSLGAVYPTAEAYAGIQTRVSQLAVGATLLASLAALILWGVYQRELRPLERLTQDMLAAAAGDDSETQVHSPASDVRALWAAYAALRQHKRAAERRLQAIMDNLPAHIALIDARRRFVSVNTQQARSLGQPAAALIGKRLDTVLDPAALAAYGGWIDSGLRGETVTFESSARLLGQSRDFVHYLVPERDGDGPVTGLYALALDITERRQAEHRLATSRAQLRAITDNLPVLIGYIDRDRRYRFCNATYEAWFRRPAASILGTLMDELIPSTERSDRIGRALGGERQAFDHHALLPIGNRHVHSEYIPDLGDDGVVNGVHVLVTDVTEFKRQERRLKAEVQQDSLTGLLNRRGFEGALGDAMARCRRSGRPMAVLFLDIDRFKPINDTHGHAVGDEVLKAFALRLKDEVRGTDAVARLGGDEFTVILEGLRDPEEASLVAVKILSDLGTPLRVSVGLMPLGTSIGIAMFDGSAGTADELLQRADEALYTAKRAGRGTYHVSF